MKVLIPFVVLPAILAQEEQCNDQSCPADAEEGNLMLQKRSHTTMNTSYIEESESSYWNFWKNVHLAMLGYNVYYAEPTPPWTGDNLRMDLGLRRKQVFDKQYQRNTFTSDMRHKTPDGYNAVVDVGCSSSFSTSSYKNEFDYLHDREKTTSLGASLEASVSYPPEPAKKPNAPKKTKKQKAFSATISGPSVSASLGVKGTISFTGRDIINKGRFRESIVVTSEAKCSSYVIAMDYENPPPPTQEFTTRVNALSAETQYYEFFEDFGTHYLASVRMGARETQTYFFDRMRWDEMETRITGLGGSFEATLGVHATIGAVAGYSPQPLEESVGDEHSYEHGGGTVTGNVEFGGALGPNKASVTLTGGVSKYTETERLESERTMANFTTDTIISRVGAFRPTSAARCNTLPDSPTGSRFGKGCSGAVSSTGFGSQAICTQGWWRSCCVWKGGTCQPKDAGWEDAIAHYPVPIQFEYDTICDHPSFPDAKRGTCFEYMMAENYCTKHLASKGANCHGFEAQRCTADSHCNPGFSCIDGMCAETEVCRVTIYEHIDFRGESYTLPMVKHGEKQAPFVLKNSNWDRKISSVKVGSGCQGVELMPMEGHGKRGDCSPEMDENHWLFRDTRLIPQWTFEDHTCAMQINALPPQLFKYVSADTNKKCTSSHTVAAANVQACGDMCTRFARRSSKACQHFSFDGTDCDFNVNGCNPTTAAGFKLYAVEPCFEHGFSRKPLDGAGQTKIVATAELCRRECDSMPGCQYYSWFFRTGACHFQGAGSEKVANVFGVTGPAKCRGTVSDDFSLLEDVESIDANQSLEVTEQGDVSVEPVTPAQDIIESEQDLHEEVSLAAASSNTTYTLVRNTGKAMYGYNRFLGAPMSYENAGSDPGFRFRPLWDAKYRWQRWARETTWHSVPMRDDAEVCPSESSGKRIQVDAIYYHCRNSHPQQGCEWCAGGQGHLVSPVGSIVRWSGGAEAGCQHLCYSECTLCTPPDGKPTFQDQVRNANSGARSQKSPDGWTVTMGEPFCTERPRSKIIKSAWDYENTAKDEFEFSIGLQVSSFSASFSMSREEKEFVTRNQENKKNMLETSAECIHYYMELDENHLPEVDPSFQVAVNAVQEATDYHKLFDLYGTSYPTKLVFGARFGYTRMISEESWSQMRQNNESFEVEVGGGVEFDVKKVTVAAGVSVGWGEDKKVRVAEQMNKHFEETKEFFIGRRRPEMGANGLTVNDAWKESVAEEPMPIKYELSDICNHPGFASKKSQCTLHLQSYCNDYLKQIDPAVKCEPFARPECTWDLDCPKDSHCVEHSCVKDPECEMWAYRDWDYRNEAFKLGGIYSREYPLGEVIRYGTTKHKKSGHWRHPINSFMVGPGCAEVIMLDQGCFESRRDNEVVSNRDANCKRGRHRINWGVSGDYCGFKLVPKKPSLLPTPVPSIADRKLVYLKQPCNNVYLGLGCRRNCGSTGGYGAFAYASNAHGRTLWEMTKEGDVVYLFNPEHGAYLGMCGIIHDQGVAGHGVYGFSQKLERTQWQMEIEDEYVFVKQVHHSYLAVWGTDSCGHTNGGVHGFHAKSDRSRWILEGA